LIFAAGVAEGELVALEKANKRPEGGPTIKTGRDLRVARDMLMKVAKDCGYNPEDIRLIFTMPPLSRSQIYARVGAVEQFNREELRRNRV
jgi:hypothetical protein